MTPPEADVHWDRAPPAALALNPRQRLKQWAPTALLNRRRTRAIIQFVAVTFTVLIAANAAYLVQLGSQTQTPNRFLASIETWGLFPFDSTSGTLSIEDYCPFGPVEGAFRFIQTSFKGGISFVGPVTLRNLGVLLALLGLVIITKKTFCSWLCPFGALFEFLGSIGAKAKLPRIYPNKKIDKNLRRLRHAVLLTIIALTGWAGILIFKEVDPFFALYSLGAQRQPVGAYATLAVLFLSALFLPGVWCWYLCPLGSFLDPFSRLGRIQIKRDEARCTSCKLCSKRCPQRIDVHERQRIVDAVCTNCLDCIDACPYPGVLELRLEAKY